MPSDPTARLIEHIRLRFGLRPRAAKVLLAILRCGDELWWCTASRADLAAATNLSSATVRRALADLQRLGVVTSHRPRGKPLLHHVRNDVIFGGASVPEDLRQLALTPPPKPRYRVRFTADGAELRLVANPGDPAHSATRDPAHSAAGEPAHFGPTEPAQRDPAPPHETMLPPEGLNDRSINWPGPAQAGSLPALPRWCWLASEDELPDRLAGWLQRHGLAAADLPGGRGLLDLLAAILAARDAEPRNLHSYVATCLRNGLADGCLARADRLLRATSAHSRSPPAWTPHGVPFDDPRYIPRG